MFETAHLNGNKLGLSVPGLCKSSPSPPLFALPDCFYLYWAIVTALNATPQRRGKKRRQNVCKAIFQCLRKSIVPPILQHSSLHLAGLQQMEPDGTQVRRQACPSVAKWLRVAPARSQRLLWLNPNMSLVLRSHDHPGRGRQGTNWRRRCLSGLGDPRRWRLGNCGQRVSRARWGP